MISITLTKRSSEFLREVGSYRVAITATVSVGVSPNIFVMQRIRDFTANKFEDNFAAVATPAQLEDIPEVNNMTESSFYRTNSIELVARTAEYLAEIVASIFNEVQNLVDDLKALEGNATTTTHVFESIE